MKTLYFYRYLISLDYLYFGPNEKFEELGLDYKSSNLNKKSFIKKILFNWNKKIELLYFKLLFQIIWISSNIAIIYELITKRNQLENWEYLFFIFILYAFVPLFTAFGMKIIFKIGDKFSKLNFTQRQNEYINIIIEELKLEKEEKNKRLDEEQGLILAKEKEQQSMELQSKIVGSKNIFKIEISDLNSGKVRMFSTHYDSFNSELISYLKKNELFKKYESEVINKYTNNYYIFHKWKNFYSIIMILFYLLLGIIFEKNTQNYISSPILVFLLFFGAYFLKFFKKDSTYNKYKQKFNEFVRNNDLEFDLILFKEND